MRRFCFFTILIVLSTINISGFEAVSYKNLQFDMINRQVTFYSCGASIIQLIVALYSSVHLTQEQIMSIIIANSNVRPRGGMSFLDIRDFLEKYNILTAGVRIANRNISLLEEKFTLPLIIHYPQPFNNSNIDGHFVLLYHISNDNLFFILDPFFGRKVLTADQFRDNWSGYFMYFSSRFPARKFEHLIIQEERRHGLLRNFFNR
ncbi:MAG: cysteine peptidase family C39 domain-containing protein [Treponema sp.]|nr:cysteine peptidase family C39 domain-containing protein [Treponema sp.]